MIEIFETYDTDEGYVVQCPACHEAVIFDLEHWHTDCGNPDINFRIKENARMAFEQRAYPDVYWQTSKKGNWYAKTEDYVLIVSADKRKPGQWSCGAFESGVDSGKPVLQWQGGFKSDVMAQENIVKRMKQHRAFRDGRN